MEYKIQELTTDLINESFFETCSNLKDIDKSIEDTKVLWQKQKSNTDYIRLVAVEWQDNVIWTISCLLEQKLIMRHAIWGHLEDVVVRKWYEWAWIWKALLEELNKIVKDRWVARVILSCNDKNVAFYEKCWYGEKSNSMDLIIK